MVLFLERENPMTDPEVHVPVPLTPPPAHPWTKTARTVLAGILTAATLLPLAISAADIDVTAQGWTWLGAVLVVLAAFTRIMAVPAINTFLQRVLGLGSKDVETSKVVALVEAEPDYTGRHRVVAGDASPIPTGATVEVISAEPNPGI